jgi:lysophospholipase L1-like esterase
LGADDHGILKPEIVIANNGESGETARSFIGEKRFAKVMSVIKPGDYLLIQFGHNDQKEKGEGVGAFTTYKATLKQFVSETREHQATPVLITSMHRRTFDADGKITNSLRDYPAAVRQLAEEEKVPLIDLNAMSKTLYEAFGPEASGKLFARGDGTHHTDYGSYELAKCVALGIKETKLPIAKYLVGSALNFDPAHPDPFETFDVPADPAGTSIKPYGN